MRRFTLLAAALLLAGGLWAADERDGALPAAGRDDSSAAGLQTPLTGATLNALPGVPAASPLPAAEPTADAASSRTAPPADAAAAASRETLTAPDDPAEPEPQAQDEAAAVADGDPGPAEGEQEPASTLELLNEDDQLEPGQDDGGAPETADRDDPDGSAPEAAALAAPDGGRVAAPGDATVPGAGELFPSSPGIDRQKAFWIDIFTRYDSRQGVLHDGRIALPVYDALDLTGMSYRVQRRYVRERKREVAGRLRDLATALRDGAPLDTEQQALLARLPSETTPDDVRAFAANVRFQRGLADRFRDGVIDSGALMERMRAILARHGVPQDLAYLPHVESSFNNATRSKYGATGIWQFTLGTGRSFMKVGYEVDERLDPLIASEAAARFLRQNFERLGTWPLAITAYNHGPPSLERITRRMGTSNLGTLIEEYEGRLFKFASKNFYAEFLAAREVARNYRRYFGELELEPMLEFEEAPLPWHLDALQAAETLGVELSVLRRLNPALQHPVWSGAKFIPPEYRLRIPAGSDPERFLAAIPDDERHDAQKRSLYVRVARGDTLYSIGRRHGIAWRSIALANNISSYHRLRPGQKLILPWDGATPPAAVAEADEPAAPVPNVVEHIAVPASAPWSGGLPVDGDEDVQADRFQELRIVRYDSRRKEGELVAAYGETVGAYADWAGVRATELRRANGMSSRSVLRPGQTYAVPLDAVTTEQFEHQRMDFHRAREQSFFAEYNITEKVKVEVRRGQSPWALAQDNKVPMWLFYRENPELLTQPMRAGMEVILPIVQAGTRAVR